MFVGLIGSFDDFDSSKELIEAAASGDSRVTRVEMDIPSEAKEFSTLIIRGKFWSEGLDNADTISVVFEE